MPVTLESRLRQMQVFNLEHSAFCTPGTCLCIDITTVVLEENPRTGERAPRNITRKVPRALTLLAGERQEGQPDSLLQVPEVKAAIARGHVRVVKQSPAPPAAAKPAAERVLVVKEE